MGQKDGKKWTAAADLQPTISKSDRLLGKSTSYCFASPKDKLLTEVKELLDGYGRKFHVSFK